MKRTILKPIDSKLTLTGAAAKHHQALKRCLERKLKKPVIILAVVKVGR